MMNSNGLQQAASQAAARLLLQRRYAQNSFEKFIEWLDVGVTPARHHRLLIKELEAVERGEIDRLMVLMPPGSAKSSYASILFPPWYMGKNPHAAVLGVSNTTELAERFSRRARNLIMLPDYQTLFGFGLNPNTTAAGSWETEPGGEYFAAGMGSAIAGRRADLGLIDDPVKTREEADSDRIRDKHWDWYVNDFLTRLKPGARQVLIQTRWHEDDLAGRLLEREGARWRVIKLPMEAGEHDLLGRLPGERLWPEWFTEEMVSTAKQDRRAWSALYQQEPSPDQGTFFQLEWFKRYKPGTAPEPMNCYISTDFAATDGGGDYTEIATHGVTATNDIYLGLSWHYSQSTPDKWIEVICDQIGLHQPMAFFGESGVIRRMAEPILRRRMMERNCMCRLEWITRTADKAVMARPLQARAAMGKIYVPDTAAGDRFIDQALRFPAGKFDDAVDCAALLALALDKAHPAIVRKPEREAFASDWG